MRDHRLTITMVAAVLVLVSISTALLLLDDRVTGAAALRTGGLGSGSVVALYALWLNDRRRRVEEQRQELDQRRQELDTERYALERRRQELEDRRTEHDRDSAADERFARAVELLGSEADQVRVGALHALAGLVRSHSDYTQTALDVLCSYLRRPFLHPRYTEPGSGEESRRTQWSQHEADLAERELQVRLTAQRLIGDLLPPADQEDAPTYDLDLTGATLEYLDLSHRRIGTLVMRYARLYSSSNLSGVVFLGPAWFTGTNIGPGRLGGRFRCADTTFHRRAWFSGVTFHGPTSLRGTRFLGPAKFADSDFAEGASLAGAEFHQRADFENVTSTVALDLSNVSWPGGSATGLSIADGQPTTTGPGSAGPAAARSDGAQPEAGASPERPVP